MMKQSGFFAMAAIGLASTVQADVISKTFVKFGDRLFLDGSVVAGTTADLATGKGATVLGPITACGVVTVKPQSTLQQIYSPVDVAPAYSASSWDAVGIKAPAPVKTTTCSAPTIPAVTVVAGTTAKTGPDNGDLTLEPGSYGAVTVGNTNGTKAASLTLKPGLYQFASLNVPSQAVIVFQKGANLKVKGNVTLSSNIVIIGEGASSAQFEVAGNFTSGTDNKFPMSILVAGALDLGDRSTFGNLTANSIKIGTDANAGGKSIPPCGDVTTSFVDRFERTGNFIGGVNGSLSPDGYAVEDATLAAKWTVSKGAIDVVKREGIYGFFSIPNPDPQGYVADLVGSASVDEPVKLETKTTFPVGVYQVNYKLSGSNRTSASNANVANTYGATVSFGDYRNPVTLAYTAPLQSYSIIVTLTQPSKFVVEGAPTSYGTTNAGVILDDVVIFKLP